MIKDAPPRAVPLTGFPILSPGSAPSFAEQNSTLRDYLHACLCDHMPCIFKYLSCLFVHEFVFFSLTFFLFFVLWSTHRHTTSMKKEEEVGGGRGLLSSDAGNMSAQSSPPPLSLLPFFLSAVVCLFCLLHLDLYIIYIA